MWMELGSLSRPKQNARETIWDALRPKPQRWMMTACNQIIAHSWDYSWESRKRVFIVLSQVSCVGRQAAISVFCSVISQKTLKDKGIFMLKNMCTSGSYYFNYFWFDLRTPGSDVCCGADLHILYWLDKLINICHCGLSSANKFGVRHAIYYPSFCS